MCKPWNIEIFSSTSNDKFFKSKLQKFCNEHANCEIELHTCASPEKFFVTILYREKET